MKTYPCVVCNEDRYAAVCPVCLEKNTGVHIDSFVVYIKFIVSLEVNGELVDFNITPVQANGINIEPCDIKPNSRGSVEINRKPYYFHAYVEKTLEGKLVLVHNDPYMSPDPTPSARAKGIDLVMSIAEHIYSGVYDDLLTAAEVLHLTSEIERINKKIAEVEQTLTGLENSRFMMRCALELRQEELG